MYMIYKLKIGNFKEKLKIIDENNLYLLPY
jgi:hypothetical protein